MHIVAQAVSNRCARRPQAAKRCEQGSSRRAGLPSIESARACNEVGSTETAADHQQRLKGHCSDHLLVKSQMELTLCAALDLALSPPPGAMGDDWPGVVEDAIDPGAQLVSSRSITASPCGRQARSPPSPLACARRQPTACSPPPALPAAPPYPLPVRAP